MDNTLARQALDTINTLSDRLDRLTVVANDWMERAERAEKALAARGGSTDPLSDAISKAMQPAITAVHKSTARAATHRSADGRIADRADEIHKARADSLGEGVTDSYGLTERIRTRAKS
jgi:type II secretory pathway component PulM